MQGQPYLLVKRYDRLPVEHTPAAPTQRLHQEDFCQALGVPPELKYQNEGGPDLAKAFALLRSATRPHAPHVLKLLGSVLFNTLIGNHDAHAKNFSLLCTPQGAVLAPMYDALSTAVYPQLTDKMAMKIGGKDRFAELHARHWEQFAVSAGLSPAQVKKQLKRVAERLPQQVRLVRAEFLHMELLHPVLNQISELIEDRCATTLRRLAMSTSQAEAETDTPDEKSTAP